VVAFHPHRPIERRDGAVARLRTRTATSAGGIVYGRDRGRPSLVIGLRRRQGDRRGGTWTLPKGTPDPGETIEETAIREVREETGLEARIVEPLPSISYRFMQDGTRIDKTVHYWLMEPTGGDLSRHDREFERVRWVSFDEAPAILTFETERSLVATAREVLAGVGEAAREPSAPASGAFRRETLA
jgi:8-oxo-dGTP pyrophosphatase MutT (NUDIX family)